MQSDIKKRKRRAEIVFIILAVIFCGGLGSLVVEYRYALACRETFAEAEAAIRDTEAKKAALLDLLSSPTMPERAPGLEEWDWRYPEKWRHNPNFKQEYSLVVGPWEKWRKAVAETVVESRKGGNGRQDALERYDRSGKPALAGLLRELEGIRDVKREKFDKRNAFWDLPGEISLYCLVVIIIVGHIVI